MLKEAFGLDQVIWLEKAPPEEEDCTKGHTDGIIRFVDEDTVVIGEVCEPNDAMADVLNDAGSVVRDVAPGLNVRRMNVPVISPKDGGPSRLNYLNWYVANGVVLVGTFGKDDWDRAAVETIGQYWPSRRVVGVNISELWQAWGGIHCVTQQQPA